MAVDPNVRPRPLFDPFETINRRFRREQARQVRADRAAIRQEQRRRRSEADRQRSRARRAARQIPTRIVSGALQRILGVGSIAIEAARVIAGAVERKQLEELDDERKAQERLIKKKIRERNRDRKLRTIGMRTARGAQRSAFPPEFPSSSPPERVLSIPEPQPSRVEIGSTEPEIEFGFPDQSPVIAPPTPDSPGPGTSPATSPAETPGPVTLPPTPPAPSTRPASPPASAPGFGIGTGTIFLPGGAPAPGIGIPPLFVGFPAQNPANLPRRGLRRRPAPSPAPAPGGLTSFAPGVLQLPQPQPVPQTDPAQRRCKPCKEDNPKPRDACFKGLYKEGPLDTEVEFTQWVEIDCTTGRELSRPRFPSPTLRGI